MKIRKKTRKIVYVEVPSLKQKKPVAPLYDATDWLMFAEAKLTLVKVINGLNKRKKKTIKRLDSLLELLDGFQDDAEAAGYPVVWAWSRRDWERAEKLTPPQKNHE